MIFHLSFPSSFDKVVFIILIFNLWVATIFCLARTHILKAFSHTRVRIYFRNSQIGNFAELFGHKIFALNFT